jgi:hypothetical protein
LHTIWFLAASLLVLLAGDGHGAFGDWMAAHLHVHIYMFTSFPFACFHSQAHFICTSGFPILSFNTTHRAEGQGFICCVGGKLDVAHFVTSTPHSDLYIEDPIEPLYCSIIVIIAVVQALPEALAAFY